MGQLGGDLIVLGVQFIDASLQNFAFGVKGLLLRLLLALQLMELFSCFIVRSRFVERYPEKVRMGVARMV